jgi:hypothetical protein
MPQRYEREERQTVGKAEKLGGVLQNIDIAVAGRPSRKIKCR